MIRVTLTMHVSFLPEGWAEDSAKRPPVEIVRNGLEALAFVNPDSEGWEDL